MSARGTTFLIVAVWLVVVIGLIVTLVSITHAAAAEMSVCRVYANRGSAMALQRLLGLPFIDVAAGKFLYRKAYSFCINADETPAMTFTPEEQPIVDGKIPLPPTKPEGVVPATDPADPLPADPAPTKTKARAKAKTATKGKALCIKHGKRTVYTGKHWRCV